MLPPEVPYTFAALPQYETERLLEEYVAGLGTVIERGTELLSFDQDATGVTARLRTSDGAEEEVRAAYLVGCDGAHSTVRKGLGLSFEGGAFPEEFMLADVETDWDLPDGYGLRSLHRSADGATDDLLVCIPLPGGSGARRYRMSMLVPPELSARRGGPRPPGATASRTEWRAPAARSCPTCRPSSTDWLPGRPPCRTCAGPPSSASATGSSTGTATTGSSSRETPRTSTRPPAPRA